MSLDRKHLKSRMSIGLKGLSKLGKHLVERGMGSHSKNIDRDKVGGSKGKIPPGKGGGGKGKGKG